VEVFSKQNEGTSFLLMFPLERRRFLRICSLKTDPVLPGNSVDIKQLFDIFANNVNPGGYEHGFSSLEML